MASQPHQFHFILFPLSARGHMIPMIDLAKILAKRGIIVTMVVSTLKAAAPLETSISRAVESGLQIHVIQLQFPCEEAGIPEGCDTVDKLLSLGLSTKFLTSTSLLQQPVEKLLEKLTPQPSCIISDMSFPWTADVARKFHIPRLPFSTVNCLTLLCLHISHLHMSKLLQSISSESEYYVLPGLPDHFEFTKSQLAVPTDPMMIKFNEQMVAADLASYGVIVNTFREMEPAYVEGIRMAREAKVWCIGPVSLCNESNMDKTDRGHNSAIEEHRCLTWLDAQEPCSVIYACLGSVCNLIPSQLIELGLGLEESNKPFIWVIRETEHSKELEKWILEERFEERIKGRGLLIRGWAPQLLILSHPSVGGFLTHGGWNSCIEGICAGVPMVIWSQFGDQFMNEKLVVQKLKIGLKVGVEDPLKLGEEEKMGVLVKKEDVKGAIDRLMDQGVKREEMRKRSRELGEMAKRAVEDGGSSHMDMTQLIQELMQVQQTGRIESN